MVKEIRALKKWLFAPQSKYKIGEAVRVLGGDNDMMVVIEIWSERGMDEPLVHCQFSNPKSAPESEFFPESAIEPFEWNLAYANKKNVR